MRLFPIRSIPIADISAKHGNIGMKNLACLNFIKLNNINGTKDHIIKNTLNFDFDFMQNATRQAINKIKNINDRIELLKLSIR